MNFAAAAAVLGLATLLSSAAVRAAEEAAAAGEETGGSTSRVEPSARPQPPAQPALWIWGVQQRSALGPLPDPLPRDLGQIVLEEHALRYVERIGDDVAELRVVPYASIVSLHTEPHARDTALLFVKEATGAADKVVSHVFIVLSGERPAGVFAADSKSFIEKRLSRRSQESRAAEHAAGVRRERIAVLVPDRPPVLIFGEPAPIPERRSSLFAESVVQGAKTGWAPIGALCSRGGCESSGEILVLGGLMAATGAIFGAAVGVVREIAAALQRTPPQPPGFSDEQILAVLPVFRAAAERLLGQSAFGACVHERLAPATPTDASLRWETHGRLAELSPVESLDAVEHDRVLEPSVTSIALVPIGTPDQTSADMPVVLEIESRLKLRAMKTDAGGESTVSWRSSPRTMDQWRKDHGASLKAALTEACTASAQELLVEAERLWRADSARPAAATAAGGPPSLDTDRAQR